MYVHVGLFWQQYAIWGGVHALAALLKKSRSAHWEQKLMINGAVICAQILNNVKIKSTNHECGYSKRGEALTVRG